MNEDDCRDTKDYCEGYKDGYEISISEFLNFFDKLKIKHYEVENKEMCGINPIIRRYLKEEKEKWEEKLK